MPQNNVSVENVGASVYPHHYLFLMWHDSISNSGLFREAIEREMEERGIDVDTALEKTASAINEGHDVRSLKSQCNDFSELEEMEETQS